MLISYNWLKEYIDLDLSAEDTAETLTLTGLEVEDVIDRGGNLDGIVVGKVKECNAHPNADKLVLCKVDVGDEILPIVCGAPNVKAGQYVPVALTGTSLPLGNNGELVKIKKSKIRGEESRGMICAEDELGLGDDHTGIMVLDKEAEPGTPLIEVLQLEKDTAFEIGLTPNRPDAACHIGSARDLSAVLDKPLKKPHQEEIVPDKDLGDKATIRITDTQQCGRYVGLMIENITVQESPQWLKNRLISIGLRPINNIVDATNFVLHETGQPLHAFDYDLLADHTIDVKSFDSQVSFTTLDEIERKVPAGSLFICDAEKPIAVAGVMGGANSEISDQTNTVLLESAWFDPVSIRKTAKKLGLQTDASYRFERGADPSITLQAALRCARLIADISGGNVIDGVEDVFPLQPKPKKQLLRHDRLRKIIGTDIPADVIKQILNRLEFEVSETAEGDFECTVPLFRPDIHGEEDLIEEVARIYDYNKVPRPDHIKIRNLTPLTFQEQFKEEVRTKLAGLGLKEIYSNSLLPESTVGKLESEEIFIPTLNPVSRDQSVLRPTLLYGFLNSAAHNFRHYHYGVRFFEIGHIFEKANEGNYVKGVKETTSILIGLSGKSHPEHWQQKPRSFSLFDIKSLVEGLFKSLGLVDHTGFRFDEQQNYQIILGEQVVGQLYEVPRVKRKLTDLKEQAYVAELDFDAICTFAEQNRERSYKPVPKYPFFEFDLALVVDKSVQAGELEQAIRKHAGNTLTDIQVFDVYEGEQLEKTQKSVAFRLKFLDNTKTLNINDVDPIISEILKQLGKEFSATLRS